MKISKKIKVWARVGQIAYFLYLWFIVLFENQLPMHEATVYSNTVEETIYAMFCLVMGILFSEAIVRVIGYFAELLDK